MYRVKIECYDVVDNMHHTEFHGNFKTKEQAIIHLHELMTAEVESLSLILDGVTFPKLRLIPTLKIPGHYGVINAVCGDKCKPIAYYDVIKQSRWF